MDDHERERLKYQIELDLITAGHKLTRLCEMFRQYVESENERN